MRARSFNEIREAHQKLVGKKWYTMTELEKAIGKPFTKAAGPVKEANSMPYETLAEAAAFIQQRDGVSRTTALSRARKEYPSLINKDQAETDRLVAKAMQAEDDETTRRFATKTIQKPFLQKVEEIRKRDGLANTAAMSKARKEFPREFQEAFGGG